MKTYSPKKQDIERTWYIVDASGKRLGRLATEIAVKLRGKDKPQFAPHIDCGDYVIVINAKDIAVTGNKMEDKQYYRHSGYPGGLRKKPLKQLLEENPEEVIIKAVRGMIPRNKLRKEVMMKLKVFAGSEHPHEAQKPQPLTD
ncbi:50S ribosomal protein L13 [Candidatus Peregrinibacteria bacterium]|nr:50S ribosomal protein L13 [Candidatus Peregrinibacteria bacterium]